MTEITNNLYIGTEKESFNKQLLKSVGITAILNVSHDSNILTDWNIKSYKIGLKDFENDYEMIELARHVLEKLLNSGNIVFLHCISCSNRAPFIAAYYLASLGNMTIESIENEWNKITNLREKDINNNPMVSKSPLYQVVKNHIK